MDNTKYTEDFIRTMGKLIKSFAHKNSGEFTRGEMFILNFLLDSDRSVQPRDICEVMMISSARVAAALKSLEEKGWVQRQGDQNDRRKVLVSITESGKKAVLEKRKAVELHTNNILNNLDEDQICEFLRLSQAIIDVSEKTKSTEHSLSGKGGV